MSTMSPERVSPDIDVVEFEAFEFEIVCDIAAARNVSPDFPPCNGDPARWVAWRPNCCSESPRYRLICDRCKSIYQIWQARHAYIWCGFCGKETGGFISFVPMEGRS